MSKPRNVILIVADSLRWDSVYRGGVGMPYAESRAVQYTQARSAGCWTLPATASMFTGLLPHDHGATAQTRAIRADVPTLAEGMSAAGYRAHQVTANPATTSVFGLDRGFDEVHAIWTHLKPRYRRVDQALAILAKPRLRRRLFSRDFIMGKLAGDFSGTKVWLQNTYADVFDQTRAILRENEARGQRSFLFLNLMEAHFPYHVGPSFDLLSRGLLERLRELLSLYHLGSQTWLKTGREHIRQEMLATLRRRQRVAWELLGPPLDAFLEELHAGTDNEVVFCSDHGDNFGEQGWLYHFSNVTDGGNRVPLFWLPSDGRPAARVEAPVSMRDLYATLLSRVGHPAGRPILLDEPESSETVLASWWYNNAGRTLPRYRHNQIAFIDNNIRYRLLGERWSSAPPQTDGPEPVFVDLPADGDPVEDAVSDPEKRRRLRRILEDFHRFSDSLRP